MKKLKFLLLAFITIVSFTACEKDDDLEFVANEAEGISFNTSFLENYVLNASVSNNLAERFTWNDADFGVPTNITYYLQGATTEDFSDYVAGESLYDLGSNVANPVANEIPVTVGKMIALAEAAGLDNDPDTSEPNTGMLYFRLMAVIGDDGLPSYSNVKALNVELQEQTTSGGSDITPAVWGVVGSGFNAWGDGGPDGQFYTTDEANVFVTYVTLIDGEIKFRANNNWDDPLGNFGDEGADGTLEPGGANIAVTAGTYKITLDLNDNIYTMEEFSWGIVGSGYNDWGNDGPDAKFYYDYTTDTFKVGVQLLDGEIKFRANNNWDDPLGDYGDTGADGTLEPGGDNIIVTAGYYTVTLDFVNNTYSIVEDDIWGIVGSGYNEWGDAGPDFALTEINPGFYYGDIAVLLDGEVKFRANNNWDSGLGDIGDNGENIAVEAGSYRVTLNVSEGTYMLNKIQ
ncbi:SusE domain-containing protein [Winogradskyella bathintestinalis]|uniref:SusE domain-containing protein n=1 Tax=Winogradskyella bathintestinalis TaxID=3035208 RepID=A0ABT7ZQE3_9FLAO|nr:SusE domain-containing protein [Winogradskyella bathintestinalis]MDN3491226.1 SusE domain-containing protein [Winogradskyella bathintestinalis]